MGSFIIGIGIACLLIFGIVTHYYNHLTHLKVRVENQWHQVDVQLQRRYELIPNLVETARTTMDFEKSTLESVVQARNTAIQALKTTHQSPIGEHIKNLSEADQALTTAMYRFLAVVEQYPDLRSVENMRYLQEELISTENRVAFSRQAYNDSVMQYNEAQAKIPGKWIAQAGGHTSKDFYPISSKDVREPFRAKF